MSKSAPRFWTLLAAGLCLFCVLASPARALLNQPAPTVTFGAGPGPVAYVGEAIGVYAAGCPTGVYRWNEYEAAGPWSNDNPGGAGGGFGLTFDTPGTYRLGVYAIGNATYNASPDTEVDFTVFDTSNDAGFTYNSTALYYNGLPQTPIVTASVYTTYTPTYTGIGGTAYGPTSTPPTNVGSYYVSATATGHWYGSTAANWSIVPMPVTFSFANTGASYDGMPHGPTITPSVVGATYWVNYTGPGWNSASQPTAVGTYTVTVGATGGYSGSGSCTLSINSRQNPVITWSPPDVLGYPTVLSSAQLNATANVPGTFTYSPEAGVVLPKGEQVLNATFTPTDLVSYNTITTSRPCTVVGESTRGTVGSQQYVYQGAQVNLIVPVGVAFARIHAWGGSGGAGYYGGGSYGGYVNGTIPVLAGDQLLVEVGQSGPSLTYSTGAGGWPNGGYAGHGWGGSGGGSSNVYLSRSGTEYARIVAGGGGGSGARGDGSGQRGGNGGGLTGGKGYGNYGAGGGTQTAGGQGGTMGFTTAYDGLPGSFMRGADSPASGIQGGGGGGGYFGGGSGHVRNTAVGPQIAGGGGGGSSYTSPQFIFVENPPATDADAVQGSSDPMYMSGTAAAPGGNGQVAIEWLPPAQSQTISFPAIGTHTFGDAPFVVTATASSGYPCRFQIVSGPATVDKNTVSLTGAGTVVIRAYQSGDIEDWTAAQVDQSFTVLQGTQSKPSLAPETFVIATYDSLPLNPAGGIGTGGWSFNIMTGGTIAAVTGTALVPNGSAGGTVQVQVRRLGDTNYTASAWSDPVTINVLLAPAPGSSKYRSIVTDLDQIFELRDCRREGTVTTAYTASQQDLLYRYAPLAAGSAAPTVKFSVTGADLNTLFAAKGTVPAVLPVCTQNPQSVNVMPGALVVLSAKFKYAASLQWYKGNTSVPGATTDCLVLPSVTQQDMAPYTLKATNANGSTTSAAADVHVKQQFTRTFTENGTFSPPSGVTTVELLVVAGGGGGGGGSNGGSTSTIGGGGGGGGGIYYNQTASVSGTMNVVVGAGGAAGAAYTTPGGRGGDSSFGSYTAGGGEGGRVFVASPVWNPPGGLSGGSSGNGGTAGGYTTWALPGGAGGFYLGRYWAGGGGGGLKNTPADGGYGGGGKGAAYVGSPISGEPGQANTGGGGGGGAYYGGGVADIAPGKGGSGVVVVRYWY